jgi:hypothetical protein
MFLVLIFTRDRVDPRATVRSEGDMSLRNPVTPRGIDPGTFRLVAQRLNHYATPGPTFLHMHFPNSWVLYISGVPRNFFGGGGFNKFS